jgi:hypothetical protein
MEVEIFFDYEGHDKGGWIWNGMRMGVMDRINWMPYEGGEVRT